MASLTAGTTTIDITGIGNGGDSSSFYVRVYSDSLGTTLVYSATVSTATKQVTGLTASTNYWVRVQPTNRISQCDLQAVTTNVALPSCPVVTVRQTDNYEIEVVYSAVAGALTYQIDIYTDPAGTVPLYNGSNNLGIVGPVKFGSTSGTTFVSGNNYYIRVNVTTLVGTSSGCALVSIAVADLPSTNNTTPADNVTSLSAEAGITVTDEGSSAVTEAGMVWSTSVNPTIADNKFVAGSGLIGMAFVTMSDLIPGTLYYYRSYAINSVGVAYGYGDSFTTAAFDIADVPNRVLHVEGDTGVTGGAGTSVTLWADQSSAGNNLELITGVGTNQPQVFNGLNGHDYVFVNGVVTQLRTIGNISNANGLTVIIVGKQVNVSSDENGKFVVASGFNGVSIGRAAGINRVTAGIKTSSTNVVLGSNTSDGSWKTFVAKYNSSTGVQLIRENGSLKSSGNVDATIVSPGAVKVSVFGNGTDSCFKSIAAIIVCETALGQNTINAIELALKTKYAHY